MKDEMRVMAEKPLNAETPAAALRSWITPNRLFFDRNQGAIPPRRVSLARWRLTVEGEVETPSAFTFEELRRMPKAIAADTLECSGNGRSLLAAKSAGNPWTTGGVGNARRTDPPPDERGAWALAGAEQDAAEPGDSWPNRTRRLHHREGLL